MKNLFIISFFLFCITSCETKNSVQSDIDILKKERDNLISNIENLSSNRIEKRIINDSLDEKILEKTKILNIYTDNKKPKYLLKLELKQSYFSLSISEHIKDDINAIEFELPVDKDFYDHVSKGTNIIDNFRWGSFILRGSYGDWEMTVVDKSIQ